MWYWTLISRFGETALLLPCATLLLLWLCHRGEWRATRAWCLAFFAAAGLTLASKLAFIGWGIGVPALDFTGFSGHSMMAATVLPVLLHRLAPQRRPGWGRAGVALGMVIALLIGYSRLPLGAHSISEVVGGLAVGIAASAGYLLHTAPLRRASPPAPLVLALAALLLGLPASGAHAPTQQWVEQFALYLSGREHPFQREDWQRHDSPHDDPHHHPRQVRHRAGHELRHEFRHQVRHDAVINAPLPCCPALLPSPLHGELCHACTIPTMHTASDTGSVQPPRASRD